MRNDELRNLARLLGKLYRFANRFEDYGEYRNEIVDIIKMVENMELQYH